MNAPPSLVRTSVWPTLFVGVAGAVLTWGTWLTFLGAVALVAAIGVAADRRGGYVLELATGLVVGAFVILAAVFTLGLAIPEGISLDAPNWIGTPFGILNGWATLWLFAALLVASGWMVVAGILALRRPRTVV